MSREEFEQLTIDSPVSREYFSDKGTFEKEKGKVIKIDKVNGLVTVKLENGFFVDWNYLPVAIEK